MIEFLGYGCAIAALGTGWRAGQAEFGHGHWLAFVGWLGGTCALVGAAIGFLQPTSAIPIALIPLVILMSLSINFAVKDDDTEGDSHGG